MKNIFWILLAVVVMAILIYLSRTEEKLPLGIIPQDTTINEVNVGGDNYDGEETYLSSNNYIPPKEKSEKFIGKTFTQCLELVAAWEDGHIMDMGDGQGGSTFLEFITNGHHHVLTFSEGVCETDEIIKDKQY